MSNDKDDEQKQESAIPKKVSIAALKEARKLTEADSKERASNKRIAVYGFIALALLLLLGSRPWEKFIDNPDQAAFSFEARVVGLYPDRNAAENAWPPRVIKVLSEKHGEMDVGVKIDLYPQLKSGDRVEVGYFDTYLPLKFRVLDRVK